MWRNTCLFVSTGVIGRINLGEGFIPGYWIALDIILYDRKDRSVGPFKRTVPKRVVCCGSWFLAVKKINKIFKQLALKSNLDLWKCVCRTFELAKFFQESNQNLHEDQYLKPFLLSPYRAFVNFKRMLVKIRFDTIKITPFLFSVLLLSASPLECFDPERCINSKSKSANISNQRAHWSHVSFAVHIHHNEAWSVRRRKGVPR